MTRIAPRWLIAAVLVGGVLTLNARAQGAAATAIDGVYNGTFSDAQGPRTLKLTLQTSGNGALTGVFTLYLPPTSHEQAYSYGVSGTFDAASGKFDLRPQRWLVPLPEPPVVANRRPPEPYPMVGMVGAFDPGTGRIAGRISPGRGNTFEATRDETESKNITSATPQADGAVPAVPHPAVPTAGPPFSPAPSPDVNSPAAIDGVFNGTYTRENGPPTKFKLTITHNRDGAAGLDGMVTIYLPTDSGTKAYTYSLKGAQDFHGEFHLFVHDWETTPPKDFKDFRAMGFKGTFLSNMNQNAARIISVQTSSPSASFNASFFVPKFEATWDATESADIKGAIAAQKAVGPPRVPPPTAEEVAAQAAAQAAAVTAHAVALKTAAPAQLASKNLVRKSQAYWDPYRTDLIRQVFDGSFDSDMGDLTQFRILFCHYVELCSKNCRAYLPANHEPLTIDHPTVIAKDSNGNVAWETQGRAWMLEVDPRFAKYYEKYNYSPLGSWGMPSMDPAFDAEKFFATETCQSAAMRQLGENLLRAAAGDLSLQQAGGTIAGAAAETDKSLPPGRFAHLVDACNAWYRDPANAKYRTEHDTEYCQCLGEKLQNVMTAEEEYYYANDFGRRFRDQILQPKQNTTDPEWPRLHPPIEDCRQ